MARKPNLQNDEARRLYRLYRIEQFRQIAGYGFMLIGGAGLACMMTVYNGRMAPRPLLAVTFGSFLIGTVIHISRRAFKEAQKITLPRRRFVPPPIESETAGAPPGELNVGDYQVKLRRPEPEDK